MIRTRVGYTGGRSDNPTYYQLAGHTETLQIDFDPGHISFETLLELFWRSHEPTARAWSAQYKAAIFAHGAAQIEAAEASKAALVEAKKGRFLSRGIRTEILPAETFYLAEEYHQKYMISRSSSIWAEISEIFPAVPGWINSTAVARINGYMGGYGSAEQLQADLPRLGLSETAQQALWQRFKR